MTNTQPAESFQIPIEAAEAYEATFVPAFFAQWAPILCDAAGIGAGHTVLDVACGTGIVARVAAERAGAAQVTGVDLNEAMLTVARRARPELDWRLGNAQKLPFADGEFDVVVSQMALMFFPDPAAALAEMARVVAPGGTVAVLVPGALDRQAAFAPFVAMAARHAGSEAVDLLTAYFRAGDLDELAGLLGAAGPNVTEQRRVDGIYRAPSVDAFVTTEVESTPLVERMSAETYQQIREEARTVLAPFTADDGSVAAPFEANLVVAVA
jgi:SAM-dependent methyltransferase